MAINIGSQTIMSTAGALTLGPAMSVSSTGIPTVTSIPGFSGCKNAGGNQYSTAGQGWPCDTLTWNIGYNSTTGWFTCPVAGIYAMGFGAIANGGTNIPNSSYQTYGYACFIKNGVLLAHNHWNLGGGNPWQQNSSGYLTTLSVGDTCGIIVNSAPKPAAPDAVAQNYGWYPIGHHNCWIVKVG